MQADAEFVRVNFCCDRVIVDKTRKTLHKTLEKISGMFSSLSSLLLLLKARWTDQGRSRAARLCIM